MKEEKTEKPKLKKSDPLVQKLSDRLSDLESQFLKFSVETQTAIDPVKPLLLQVQSLQKTVNNHRLELKIL
jgi:hypothetical protein